MKKKIYSCALIVLILLLISACSKKVSDMSRSDTTGLKDGEYIFEFVDENGEPVNSVSFIVCNDDMCMRFSTEETNLLTQTMTPTHYTVHILDVPEGYVLDTETEYVTEVPCDHLVIIVNTAEK